VARDRSGTHFIDGFLAEPILSKIAVAESLHASGGDCRATRLPRGLKDGATTPSKIWQAGLGLLPANHQIFVRRTSNRAGSRRWSLAGLPKQSASRKAAFSAAWFVILTNHLYSSYTTLSSVVWITGSSALVSRTTLAGAVILSQWLLVTYPHQWPRRRLPSLTAKFWSVLSYCTFRFSQISRLIYPSDVVEVLMQGSLIHRLSSRILLRNGPHHQTYSYLCNLLRPPPLAGHICWCCANCNSMDGALPENVPKILSVKYLLGWMRKLR
jgi:hypothetical protein